MLALLLGPFGRYLGGAALIVAVLGGIYWKGRNDGQDSFLEQLRARREAEAATAAEIERRAAACSADPQCVLPDAFRQRVPSIRPDPGK